MPQVDLQDKLDPIRISTKQAESHPPLVHERYRVQESLIMIHLALPRPALLSLLLLIVGILLVHKTLPVLQAGSKDKIVKV